MIKSYDADTTVFSGNGLKIIKPYKANVFKEDNGDYYVELEAGLDYIDYLKQDMIVRVPTPWGVQGFRCDKPTKTSNKIKVKAWHLFYDTENYVVASKTITNATCISALNSLNSGCDQVTPFSVTSDNANTASYECIRQTLANTVNEVLKQWGGHLYRDNWTVGIKSELGQDRGVTLAYGKNIQEITAEENWDSVCTKILPVGAEDITLDETYLVSATQYDIPYTKVVSFEQKIDNDKGEMTDEEYKTALKADLRTQATAYLQSHALPEVNYTLKAHLTNIADVGDTIWVKHPKCKIDIETHVISVQWDAIRGRYKEIEFGNFKEKLGGLKDSIINDATNEADKKVEASKSFLNKKLEQATAGIMGVLGNSYVIYDGDKILVVDQLPKENAVNVIRINAGGIGFSTTGINGTFNSAWTIDGTLDMQEINVANLTGDAITGGTISGVKFHTLNTNGNQLDVDKGAIVASNSSSDTLEILASLIRLTNDAGYKVLITGDGISFYEPNSDSSNINIGCQSIDAMNYQIWAKQFVEDGTSLANTYLKSTIAAELYADKNHGHNYYGSGDTAYFNKIYISNAETATSGGANARLAVTSPYQLMYAAGSTKKIKKDIKKVTKEELNPEKLYDIKVVQFKYRKNVLDITDQRYDKECIGFIAEQVFEVYPIAAEIESGKPTNWEARYIIPPMLKLIQDQRKEIDALTKRVERLEGKIEYISNAKQ